MPSATDKYRKVGDMWERGSGSACLEDGRGTVVVVVVESQGHRQRSSRLPDNKRGGRNNKYKAIIAIKSIPRKMTCNRCSNVGTMHVARNGDSSGDESPVPGDYRTGCPEGGGDYAGGVVCTGQT